MEEQIEIDDSLYSRQRYVLGDSAMLRMAKSNVFLSGLGGLGVEIAKNIVLAGVKSLTLHDVKSATRMDLSANFFLTEDSVTKSINRATACCSRVAELNPYVTVRASTETLDEATDLVFLKEFECVVLTEVSLNLQVKINAFCRSQNPPIKFISSDLFGVFSCVFCDFGDEFEVVDPNGEEPIESYVGKITKGNPGVVEVQGDSRHGLENGNVVTFREIFGMDALNGTRHSVIVLSPTKFSIGDISSEAYKPYTHGGIVQQVKVPIKKAFQPLKEQLKDPTLMEVDFAKLGAPLNIHVALQALHHFIQLHKRFPAVRDEQDCKVMTSIAKDVAASLKHPIEINEKLVRDLSFTASGLLAPVATAIGGIVAQEALKAVTGKFTPLSQWLLLDSRELLVGQDKLESSQFQPRGDRYDALRICLGSDIVEKLANQKLFMVGCGAIGCEMLKNYAMLGIGRGPDGKIIITDNDIIEKSNLNRQFLFRSHHIQQSKSIIAAASTRDINPDLKIEPQEYKVGPLTASTVYTDEFFRSKSIMVNALDNVEARRYMDSRCVSNQRPLLESGTMGTKGHVQVIVPHLTESYSSQQDPPEREVPYCTLKSFPASIEHTIQWARDKFETLFAQKPIMYNKFWEQNGQPSKVAKMDKTMPPENVVKVVKFLTTRPKDWAECVSLARIKFEKYYNHKAKSLLHAFPLNHKLENGSPFWQTPKRPPTPLNFDLKNDLHFGFILSTAKLYSSICSLRVSEEDYKFDKIASILSTVKVPEFRPSSKPIITDESVKAPPVMEVSKDDVEQSFSTLLAFTKETTVAQDYLKLQALEFEKDDDTNGHIDFITAASNLRAEMYSIETADRYKTKRIAGKIVPAIATTTAAVAGLVTIELIKVVMELPLESYRNAFMTLALPALVFSEPAPPEKTVISGSFTCTIWDKWEVRGNPNFKLGDFMQKVKEMYKMDVSMIVQGVKMVYIPAMPAHRKRVSKLMTELVKMQAGVSYVDLTVTFVNPNAGEDDIAGPIIRYYL